MQDPRYYEFGWSRCVLNIPQETSLSIAPESGNCVKTSVEIDLVIDVDRHISTTESLASPKGVEECRISGKWEPDMSKLRTLTAYVGFGPRAQDYTFLGLPVYEDQPLSSIWEPAETLNFSPFCVYKMNAPDKLSTTVIFKRSQKSEHLVNMKRPDRGYAVDFAASLMSGQWDSGEM